VFEERLVMSGWGWNGLAAQEQTWSGGMAFQMALVARAAISHMNALFGGEERVVRRVVPRGQDRRGGAG
jgi:hypothetical protein